MSVTKDQLKEYKLILRKFAIQFNIDQKVAQRAVEQLLAFGLTQPDQSFTTEMVLAIASDPTSILHDAINWTLPVEKQIEQADALINLIPLFIASNNNVYTITKI